MRDPSRLVPTAIQPGLVSALFRRGKRGALASVLLGASFAGCASPRMKAPSPAAALEPPASAETTEPAAPTTEPAASEAPVLKSSQTVEILGDEGAAHPPLTLLEASRRAKERNRNSEPPRIVINNQNLAEYAKRGNVTYASPKPADATGPTPAAPAKSDGRDEEYWRSGSAEIRQEWRNAIDDLKSLRHQAEELRFKFYSTDDAAYRDLQVKPEWDRALDRIVEARKAVEDGLTDLDDFLEEGRIAGALPGWLREGIELEPSDEELAALFEEETAIHEASEPVVTNDPPLVGEPRSDSEDDEDP